MGQRELLLTQGKFGHIAQYELDLTRIHPVADERAYRRHGIERARIEHRSRISKRVAEFLPALRSIVYSTKTGLLRFTHRSAIRPVQVGRLALHPATACALPLAAVRCESAAPAGSIDRAPTAAVQDGFTLIEILIAMVLALVVVVAPLLFLVTSTNQQNQTASRASASRQAESGLELMARDLREAISQDAAGNTYTVTVSNPTTSTTAVSFTIPTPGSSTTQTVTWTCPSTGASAVGTCTRTVGGSAASKIIGVNSVTFSPLSSSGAALAFPATNPSYLGIALSVQAISQLDNGQTHVARGASSPILVQTGIDLRNET